MISQPITLPTAEPNTRLVAENNPRFGFFDSRGIYGDGSRVRWTREGTPLFRTEAANRGYCMALWDANAWVVVRGYFMMTGIIDTTPREKRPAYG